MFGHELRARIYFVLAGIGLFTAWWFNAIASLEGQDYIKAWFGSAVDWVLSLDLLIVILALVVFMLYEAKKLGMKRVWLYFLASCSMNTTRAKITIRRSSESTQSTAEPNHAFR